MRKILCLICSVVCCCQLIYAQDISDLRGRMMEQNHLSDPFGHQAMLDESPANLSSLEIKISKGESSFIFSWDEELTAAFPEGALPFEANMHGGFTEDPETGSVYTGIPGYGLCAISADLQTWQKIGTDERLKDNIHGIVFFIHKGERYLAVAQNGKRVLVLDILGNVVSDILKPSGDEFDFIPANDFFKAPGSNFGVTDLTYLDGTLYVAHGYSKGDFILTIEEQEGSWTWGKLAWGGKGTAPGQFQTAHGIFAHQGQLYVANREVGEIVKFRKDGGFIADLSGIPPESRVCNVTFSGGHFFFNALSPIGNQQSAPVYIHSGEGLEATVIPGDLGVPVMINIHQVWPHYIKDAAGKKQLYLIIHAWNPGKYVVLKQQN